MKKTILIYGDSNTYGVDPAKSAGKVPDPDKTGRLPKEDRYPSVIQEILGDEYDVIPEGLPGRTTVYADPVYPFFDGRAHAVPIIKSHTPIHLLVVNLGVNDLKVTFTPEEDTLKRAMQELLKVLLNPYLYDDWKAPKLLLVSPTAICDNIEKTRMYGMYDYHSRELSLALGRIYKGVADEFGCEFFDAAGVSVASELDAIHLDAQNHHALGEALAAKIKEIL